MSIVKQGLRSIVRIKSRPRPKLRHNLVVYRCHRFSIGTGIVMKAKRCFVNIGFSIVLDSY